MRDCPPILLGHRGDLERFSSGTRESVLSAFSRADGVELDLNLSKDNIFYFYHEGDWGSAAGAVLGRERSLKEAASMAPPGESLLTLSEGIALAGQYGKILLVHLEIGGGGKRWARDFGGAEIALLMKTVLESGISSHLLFFHTVHEPKGRFVELHGFKTFYRGIPRPAYGMYRYQELKRLADHIEAGKTLSYVINHEKEFDDIRRMGLGYVLTDRLSLGETDQTPSMVHERNADGPLCKETRP